MLKFLRNRCVTDKEGPPTGYRAFVGTQAFPSRRNFFDNLERVSTGFVGVSRGEEDEPLFLLLVLRIALYAQLLLGLGRFSGLIASRQLWDFHISLGVFIVVVAIAALRTRPPVQANTIRTLVRFAPIVVLLLGVAMMTGALRGTWVTVLHMLLGIITVGLVDMAYGRQRRQLAGSGDAGAN